MSSTGTLEEVAESVQDAQETINDTIPSETIENIHRVVREAQENFEQERIIAEKYINIDEPWDYSPNNYSPDDKARKTAIIWAYEGCEQLKSVGDNDLRTLAERADTGNEALCKEIDNNSSPHKGLHLLLSSLDGLITWLCENDSDIDYVFQNPGGKSVYFAQEKKDAIEKWYDEYAIFGVENNEGTSFKDTWENFWYHRHRIMHGSPEAYYDENVGIAALFFVGLTTHVVRERHDTLS